MKSWSIRQRILLSFALVIAMMITMAVIAYARLTSIETHAISLQTRSLQALDSSTQIFLAWQENYSLTQSLVIQPDPVAFDKVKQQLDASRASFDDLTKKYKATLSEQTDREVFDSLQTVRHPYEGIQDQIVQAGVDLRNDGPRSQAMLRLLGSQFAMAHNAVAALAETSRNNARIAAQGIVASVGSAKIGIVISFLIALALAIASGFFLLRSITHPLGWLVEVMDRMRQGDFTQRIDRTDEFGALGQGFNRMADELAELFGQVQASGDQVGTSVAQIATTAKEQQATASEIATTTTEIGATSKEISATSKELARTMIEVAAVAEETASLAGSGQAGVSRMESTMHQVVQAAGSINDKLSVLNEKASNINQVVTTITKVADQTNLLSLNAAIEAEKAGEYGRGFAVVASEIRRLADQTAVATYDIEQMVKEIQSAVSAGVMGMDKFSEEVRHGMDDVHQVGSQLSQIIAQVQALVPRFETANEGMQAQATGAEQITEALLQLTDAAQQTVESLRQSTLAIDDLNHVSTTLRSRVSRVKLAAA